MKAIRRIDIGGFGPFEHAVFEIPEELLSSKVVLFVGPNGSGKTALLEALACAAGQTQAGIAPLPRARARRGTPPSFEVHLGDGTALEAAKKGSVSWAAFAYSGIGRGVCRETEGSGKILTEPEWTEGVGRSLAEAMGKRVGQFDDAIKRIGEALSALIARKVSIEFPLDRHAPRILFDGEEIPIEYLGDGMRRTFSWVIDLLVRLQRISWVDVTRSPIEQEFWLLLDELDESLHPAMQLRLLPVLRNLFPNAQLYVATHSPFVVASVGEGVVFSIRPDGTNHLVSGNVPLTPLTPGRSIEWVVEEVFDTPATFVDAPTKEALARHQEAVRALRRGQPIDQWAFTADRRWLLALNSEVSAIVLFRESPVRSQIDQIIGSQQSEAV